MGRWITNWWRANIQSTACNDQHLHQVPSTNEMAVTVNYIWIITSSLQSLMWALPDGTVSGITRTLRKAWNQAESGVHCPWSYTKTEIAKLVNMRKLQGARAGDANDNSKQCYIFERRIMHFQHNRQSTALCKSADLLSLVIFSQGIDYIRVMIKICKNQIKNTTKNM